MKRLTRGPDLSEVEAKYRSYTEVAFTELLLRFKTSAGTGELTVPLGARSTAVLLSTPIQASIGLTQRRAAWISAVSGSNVSVPDNCIDEGALRRADDPNYATVRLGSLFNNEADCITVDTAIGIGLLSPGIPCKGPAGVYGSDVYSPAFAWLFVR
jgi:hypothetical protein